MGRKLLLCGALLLLCVSFAPLATLATEDAPAAAPDAPVKDVNLDRAPRAGAQKFEFQAEVSRLMDIIINSLYSNKDIFLRELISNASDAMDKIRFLSLTEPSVLGEGDTAKLDIKISLDKENKVITIRDKGIGMTREDLVNNLGTIAKSGTSAFLENMQKGGDMNLIGQFGVGFYSVYLVADYVEVISKHNDDKQYIWESKADGNFAVSEDTKGEPLGRGTKINIYLKDEALEYADQEKLKELVTRYSEFINFPIYVWTEEEKTVEVEVPEEEITEEEKAASELAKDEDDETEEAKSEEEEKPKKKYETKIVSEWTLVNNNKAIWLRNTNEVTDEEYEKFYKALAKDYEGPLATSHFRAEGDVEFRAILFVPKHGEPGQYDNYYSKGAGLKLYVRRVFISDEFDELLPRYLSFLKGIVDSDTLPLNVSRETLQQHSSLKTIKKKLVRKALDIMRKLADEDEEEKESEEYSGAETKYEKLWKTFGKNLKMGIIEDASNRSRLSKLLRFTTSQSEGKLTSLDAYIKRMKPGQKHIYYVAGESEEALKKSPFVEKLLAKGFEVVYFTESVDEYMMQNLSEYEDVKFQNAAKEDLKLGEDSEAQKAHEKKVKKEYKVLTKWWKALLPAKDVDSVKISNRLDKTPCVVVSSKYGWSANMERIMKAQALSEGGSHMKGKRTLEINPRHPIIKKLKEMVVADTEDVTATKVAKLLYETSLLESGYSIDDAKSYNDQVIDLVKGSLAIEGDLEVEPEQEFPADEPKEAKEAKEPKKPKEYDPETGLPTEARGADVDHSEEYEEELARKAAEEHDEL